MLLRLIEEDISLDEVVFYDTGMEFQAVYNVRDMILPLLKEKGIRYVELKPETPFLYDMLERPVQSKEKGCHLGYGWCGGVCRWGTANKLKALDKYQKRHNAIMYVGLAADEPERVRRLPKNKISPLAEWEMTEKECLTYCRRHGIHWTEGGVDLYDILDRVSCWCCSNKNKKELFNIWKYLPDYWEKLKELQSRLQRPMKKYNSRKYGEYGNLFVMEKAFEEESWYEQLSLSEFM